MRKKRNCPRFVCVLLAVVCVAEGAWIAYRESGLFSRGERSAQALYAAAVEDAAFAEDDEVLPLIALVPGSAMTTWHADGERVLLMTWHAQPQDYRAGESVAALPDGVWTFSGAELRARVAQEGVPKDWALRLEQMIGLPPDCGYTHVSALFVRPEDVVRPAYVTDPTLAMHIGFENAPDGDFETWYRAWFDANTLFSYFESAYPWTRLGYTYDWADNGREYGLSEFLILPNTPVEVAFTMTTDEFTAWLTAK